MLVYPIIYKVLAPSQVVIAGFLNHQQYQKMRSGKIYRSFERMVVEKLVDFQIYGSIACNEKKVQNT